MEAVEPVTRFASGIRDYWQPTSRLPKQVVEQTSDPFPWLTFQRVGLSYWGIEHVENRADGRCCPAALVDRVAQDALKPREMSKLGPDLRQVSARDVPHIAAGPVTRRGQRQQSSDVLDPKAQRASVTNERQAPDMGRIVGPVTAFGAVRRRHEPDALVVADSLQVDPGRRCHPPDGKTSRTRDHFPLDPVVATGCTVAR